MNSIAINYIIENKSDEQSINKILQNCRFDNLKIYLNLFDFTIEQNLKSILKNTKSDANVIVNIFEESYEDKANANEIIINNIIQFSDTVAMVILNDKSVLNKDLLEDIDFEILNSVNTGFLYSDYIMNDIRCFLLSHISGVNLNLPIIFWSTSKLIKHMSKDVFKTVLATYAGIHIPSPLFIMNYDE